MPLTGRAGLGWAASHSAQCSCVVSSDDSSQADLSPHKTSHGECQKPIYDGYLPLFYDRYAGIMANTELGEKCYRGRRCM